MMENSQVLYNSISHPYRSYQRLLSKNNENSTGGQKLILIQNNFEQPQSSFWKKYWELHSQVSFGSSLQNSTDGKAIIESIKKESADPIDPFLIELESFYQLDDNWDGEGASEIPHVAISQAKQFLRDILDANPKLRPLDVAASPLGEVVIYWGSDKSYKEVTFDGEGGGFFCYEENDKTYSIEDKENSEDSFLENSWFTEVIKKLNEL